MSEEEWTYPIFKGLQKPLEFMGIRGRFITITAIAVGSAILSYLIISIVVSQAAGLIAFASITALSLLVIYIKQKTGLHSKKRYKGVICYKNLYKH